jgi:quercetin dioxygenase-like cupin family protein
MTEARAGDFGAIAGDEPYPGVVRRVLDARGATLTRYEFAPGAAFPLHRHPQEQITLVEHGLVEFTVNGEVQRLGPGGYSVVPGDVEHGLRAGVEGARIVAIVVPARSGAGRVM